MSKDADKKKIAEVEADSMRRACDNHDQKLHLGIECSATKMLRGVAETLCPTSATALHGPAQVATQQYRDNWDGIFGKVETGRA